MSKKSLLVLASVIFMIASIPASAQGKYGKDSAECVKYIGFYEQYVKQKNLKDAAPLWRKAISICPPTARQNMLLDGMKIIRMELAAAQNDPVRQAQLVDTLRMLHQMRVDNYPKYRETALVNMSMDLLTYELQKNPEDVYKVMNETMVTVQDIKKIAVTIPVRYVGVATDLFKEGKITAEEMMAAYQIAKEGLAKMKAAAATDEEKAAVAGAEVDTDKLFTGSGVASCENLVAIYEPQYSATPEDKSLLATMVSAFAAQNCLDEDLFLKAVVSLHKFEPSYNSAYFLFKLYSNKDDHDNAVKSIREAIDYPESDAATDAGYYFELSHYLWKKHNAPGEAVAAAKNAAKIAVEIGDKVLEGKAYMTIAQIWAQQSCSGNEIESRGKYWVAVDYLVKAKNCNSALAEDCSTLISQYSKFFPLQSEAFMYDAIDGTSFTVSCGGMSESTIVRTQK